MIGWMTIHRTMIKPTFARKLNANACNGCRAIAPQASTLVVYGMATLVPKNGMIDNKTFISGRFPVYVVAIEWIIVEIIKSPLFVFELVWGNCLKLFLVGINLWLKQIQEIK